MGGGPSLGPDILFPNVPQFPPSLTHSTLPHPFNPTVDMAITSPFEPMVAAGAHHLLTQYGAPQPLPILHTYLAKFIRQAGREGGEEEGGRWGGGGGGEDR